MIILKICKDQKHVGREIKSYGSFNRINSREIVVGDDTIFFATPCFVDAEKYHKYKFDYVENMIDPKDTTDQELRWIMEIYGSPEIQIRNPDPID